MSYKPLYIADLKSGLVRDKEAYLIPQDAFPDLNNSYIWRGRIKKRKGFAQLGRLRRNVTGLAQTATGANPYVDADLLNSVRATEPNAEIIPGTVTIIIDSGGANQTTYRDNVTSGILTLIAGPLTVAGFINYFSGAITITFAPPVAAVLTVSASLSYYPTLPAMDLSVYEVLALNAERLIAFDTKYAYLYNTATNQFEEWMSWENYRFV